MQRFFAKIDGLGAVQCNVAAHVGPAVDFAFGEVVDAAVLTDGWTAVLLSTRLRSTEVTSS